MALAASAAAPIPLREVLGSCYMGGERLHYDVSWTGGIKIGDLHIEVDQEGPEDSFVIRAMVSDYGMFKFFYPVDDEFVTRVRGPRRLPVSYQVHQREGHGIEARRFTTYDQDRLEVSYRKNDEALEHFKVDGPVHNEFSSFYATRTMPLEPGPPFIVPTFADKKRHEVPVEILGRETVNSIFGPVETVKVTPRMPFKGLYDKSGATVIWLTDDQCRVPVQINSEIVIGSLTATLVSYDNPSCKEY